MFNGYEAIPAEGMVRHGRTTIRITVSAKKVCLSDPLIRALGHPSYISFYQGVDENEGKIIIAAAQDEDEKILITPDRKKVFFCNNDFVTKCGRLLQKYAGGTFKRGTFYSIEGIRIDEDDAFVFDFREAVEHLVKSPGYNGRHTRKKQVAHPAFNMPMGYQAMM